MCLFRAFQNLTQERVCGSPLYKIKTQRRPTHVFSLNVPKNNVNEYTYVCLCLRSKNTWEQSAHPSNPKPHSRILYASSLKFQRRRIMGACVCSEQSKISLKTLSCVHLSKTKKRERRCVCFCSEPSKAYLYKAYKCPLYLRLKKKKHWLMCLARVTAEIKPNVFETCRRSIQQAACRLWLPTEQTARLSRGSRSLCFSWCVLQDCEFVKRASHLISFDCFSLLSSESFQRPRWVDKVLYMALSPRSPSSKKCIYQTSCPTQHTHS
jgi:hypothetical protein